MPRLPTGSTISNYQLIDQLDPRLSATTTDVTVRMSGTNADTTLSASTDYAIESGTVGGVTYLTVTFTQAGRAKILAARAGGDDTTKVRMVVNATLQAQGTGSGEITNDAYLIPSGSTSTWTAASPSADQVTSLTENGYPTDDATSKYGKVTITKTGTDKKAAATYAGASFTVYSCSADGTLSGSPLSVGGTSAFTTGSDGTVTIDGLKNNDWSNGAAVAATTYYCLVETKAPSGYELQTAPIPFQVLQTNATADNGYTVGETVTDVPKNGGFTLPLTGAAGVLVLVLAGLLLVAGSILLWLRNKRRNA